MARAAYSITIDASAEQVFEAVVDWRRQSDWIPLTTVRPGFRDGVGVGGELSAFTGIGQIGFLDTMTITRWQPPFRVDVVHTGEVVRGTATMAVRPLSATTARFYWLEDLALPLGAVGVAGWWLSKPILDVPMRRSLKQFRDLVESSAASSG